MYATRADRVWSRAALDAGGVSPSVGDRALADLLRVHGMVMNGGVDHAFDVIDPEQLAGAIRGFEYFGFDAVAKLLTRAQATSEPERTAPRPGGLLPTRQADQ